MQGTQGQQPFLTTHPPHPLRTPQHHSPSPTHSNTEGLSTVELESRRKWLCLMLPLSVLTVTKGKPICSVQRSMMLLMVLGRGTPLFSTACERCWQCSPVLWGPAPCRNRTPRPGENAATGPGGGGEGGSSTESCPLCSYLLQVVPQVCVHGVSIGKGVEVGLQESTRKAGWGGAEEPRGAPGRGKRPPAADTCTTTQPSNPQLTCSPSLNTSSVRKSESIRSTDAPCGDSSEALSTQRPPGTSRCPMLSTHLAVGDAVKDLADLCWGVDLILAEGERVGGGQGIGRHHRVQFIQHHQVFLRGPVQPSAQHLQQGSTWALGSRGCPCPCLISPSHALCHILVSRASCPTPMLQAPDTCPTSRTCALHNIPVLCTV